MVEPDLILEASKQLNRKKAMRLFLLSLICFSCLFLLSIYFANIHANYRDMDIYDLKSLGSAIGILFVGVFISFLFTIFSLVMLWKNKAAKIASSRKEEISRISSEIESGGNELDKMINEKNGNRNKAPNEDDEDEEHHSFIKRTGYQSMAEKAGRMRIGPRL